MRLLTGLFFMAQLFAATAYAQPDEVAVYHIDAENSDVYWQVYKAGALSGLGHNHVISATQISGTVEVHPPGSVSLVSLEIPLAELEVDDPVLRQQLGDAFAGEPSDRDIAGTRRNMLGPRVLDADNHPLLLISGTAEAGTPGTHQLMLTIQLAGNTSEVTVPVAISVGADSLVAAANFRLTHEELGLRPFRVMLGALQVADEMDFSFQITARRPD